MKQISLIAALLCSAAAVFAQEPDPVRQAYDLQKTSKQIYKDYYYRLKNVVDSVIYHSGIDSLDCTVFDNVEVRADGTTLHDVKANSSDDKINGEVEEALSALKLPYVEVLSEDGNAVPIDVTASYSIVSSAKWTARDFCFKIVGGEVQWLDPVPEALQGPLANFTRRAFYHNDSGNFKLYMSTFDVNSNILALGDFTVYRTGRKSEELFIRYSGGQFAFLGNPFSRTNKQIAESNNGFMENVTKPLFMGKDANSFAAWVSSQLTYPPFAKNQYITGKVKTCFTITEDGKVTGVKITGAVHPTLDREAFNVLISSPDWTPAYINGEAIEITYSHPLIFALRDSVQKYEYSTPDYLMNLNWQMTTSR